MFTFLKTQSLGKTYWLILILLGFVSEAVALYYQHVLDYGPCPICIHTRLLVLGFMLVAFLALIIRSTFMLRIFHLLNTAIMIWLCERTYILLGTEKGFVLTECGIDSGLPSWLAVDQWFPAVFKATESCGYTPLMPFGVSMAEALIVLFPVLLLISVAILISALFATKQN